MGKFFLLLLMTTSLCLRGEISQARYPLPSDALIVQLSLPRTGSTLLFNILQYLFESGDQNRVIKTHTFSHIPTHIKKDKTIYLVSSLRSPLDQLASRILTFNIDPKETNFLLREVKALVKHQKKLIRTVTKQKHSLLLNYDQFSDFDYLFDNLERFFEIHIAEEDRAYIRKNFCKESFQKVSDALQDYTQIDPLTNLHGNHIHQSFPGYWKGLISPSLHPLFEASAK